MAKPRNQVFNGENKHQPDVPNCFFVHWMKKPFEKREKQDAPPNTARNLKSKFSLTISLLAVFVLPWLVVSMPVNAAGSGDKKDSVTVTQAKSHKVPTVQSAKKLVVSEKKGRLSLKAVSIELAQVLAALSKASGVPIKLLDQAGAKDKITISFQDKTIQAAVSQVMSTLSAGGFASVGGDNGTKQTIYVVTKKGADNFRSKAQAMIDRINKGEKPTPVEIRAWLLNVAAFGFPIDPAGTSMFIVPVLMLMDQNYPTYKGVSLSILQDANGLVPLRSAMLELAGRHWTDPDSRKTLEEVFQRSADNSVLQGMVSRTLAGHGENIGDLVVQRYPDVSPAAKFYYAQAISTLGRTDAIPMLLDDSQQTQNSALRDVAISSLIKLDPSSTQTVNVVSSVIHSAQAVPTMERTASDMEREAIAMHAVMAVAEADGPQAMDRMLAIARDESVAVDVRLTSLQVLAPKVNAMNPNEINILAEQLVALGDQVSKSSQLSEMNQQRIVTRITILQKMLISKKGP